MDGATGTSAPARPGPAERPGAGAPPGGSAGVPGPCLPARPLRADARRNYERLLTAAAAAFAEHDADDTSLEEIARRAGVGIGMLYRHFPNRAALLEAVYRDQVDAVRAKADELLESDSPSEA